MRMPTVMRNDGKFRELLDSLIQQGWTIERSKNRHYKFISPEGKIVFSSGSPSDWRVFYNLRAQLRRAGAQL